MTSIFASLNTALRALNTMQKAIQTTGHNISNAATPGYSRQKVIFSATDPYTAPAINNKVGAGQVGTGVGAVAIQRYRSDFLDSQIQTETWNLNGWEVRQDALQQAQVVLNEPSDSGLNTGLNEFWASWQSLAATPDSAAARAHVAETAAGLTAALREGHEQLNDLRLDLNDRVRMQVQQVNDLAYRIADYNQKIAHVESIGQQANDMRDERTLIIKELSSVLNVTVGENENGSTMVSMGGKLLVMDFRVNELAAEPDGTNELLNKVVWANTGDAVEVKGVSLEGGMTALAEERLAGTLGGTLISRDLIVTEQMNNLDEIANALIGAVNGVHQSGYGLNNLTGGSMTATTIPGTVDGFAQTSGPWDGLTGLPAGDFSVEVRDNGGTLQFQLTDGSGNPIAINNASLPDPVPPAIADPAVDITTGWQDFNLVAGTTFDTGRGVEITFGALDPNAITSETIGSNVAGFATGGVAQGMTELPDGRYYVEVNASEQFRLVDNTGTPVGVYDIGAGNGALTTGWQPIPDATDAYTFDTARGLTVQFDAALPHTPKTYGGTPPPESAVYDAWGNQTGTAANGAAQVSLGNFFSGSGARDIDLSDYIKADYNRIATAAGPDSPGDGSVALDIYQLSSAAVLNNGTTNISDFYTVLIGKLGQDGQQASIMTENHAMMVNHLENRQEEVAGVSMDEETTYLLQYQRTYQAAARVMTTVDEMLEKVINGMGLVGR